MVQEVESWTDKSQYGLVFQAGDGTADSQGPVNLYRAREMLYSPNYFGPGQPAVVAENASQGLYVSFPANSWNISSTGEMFTKTRWTNTSSDEYFGLVLGNDTINSDAGGANQGDLYFLNLFIGPNTLKNGTNYANALRISDGSNRTGAGAVWDENLSGGTDAPFPQNTYVTGSPNPPAVYSEMSSTGTTPGNQLTQGSWNMNVNGTTQSLYVNLGVPTIGWTNLLSSIDYASLGTINRSQDDQSVKYTRLGKNVTTAYGNQVMIGGVLPTRLEAGLNAWFLTN